MASTRIASLDIAKGLGILLVVFGHQIDYFHLDCPGAYPFIYLFHVPLFFFLSGIFYNDSDGLWPFVKKKFLRLYIPYLLANVFFFTVEMTRAKFMGDSYDGSLKWPDLFYAISGLWPVPSMLSRPTWFILILFRISILYKLIQLISGSRKWITALICTGIGITGLVFAPEAYMIGQTMVALPFFCAGNLIGRRGFEAGTRTGWPFIHIAILLAAIPSLYAISLHQNTNIAVNVYGNPLLLVTGAIIGIAAVICLAGILSKTYYTSRILEFIGRHTLPILIWHIFIMKVIFTLIDSGNIIIYFLSFIAAVGVPCAAVYLKPIILKRVARK